MDCKKIKNKLHLFIDDELNEKEKAIVKNHLSKCPVCQKELEKFAAINSIAKAKIFNELEPEYWKKLTNNIMEKIGQAGEKQSSWRVLLGKIGNLIMPEKLNYRIVGLAAATVILIFFIKISFFDSGKFNLPMEMEEIESTVSEPDVEKDEETLDEFKKGQKVLLKKVIQEETQIGKIAGRKNQQQKKSMVVGGVNKLAKQKGKLGTQKKRGDKGTTQLKNESQMKKLSERTEGKAETKEILTVTVPESPPAKTTDAMVNQDVAASNKGLAIADKSQQRKTVYSISGISVNRGDSQQVIPAKQHPDFQNEKINYASREKCLKNGEFEYQPTAIKATRSNVKEDSFLNLINTINTKEKAEEKVKQLKSYLLQFPDSNFKEQATFLLAKKLIELANEKNTESTLKEAIEFFHKNKNEIKFFENYQKLKTDIKELEDKLKK